MDVNVSNPKSNNHNQNNHHDHHDDDHHADVHEDQQHEQHQKCIGSQTQTELTACQESQETEIDSLSSKSSKDLHLNKDQDEDTLMLETTADSRLCLGSDSHRNDPVPQEHLFLDGIKQQVDGVRCQHALLLKQRSNQAMATNSKCEHNDHVLEKKLVDCVDNAGCGTVLNTEPDIKKLGFSSDLNIAPNDNSVDSDDSRESSSSIAFAERPSLDDVADDLSEISDLELNFDGPIEWPDRTLLSEQSGLESDKMKSGAAPLLENAAAKLLLYQGENTELQSVDPRTQARLEALLEAAGIGKLSTTDGKAFADPEVLRKLTSSVSCALDEAAAALTRMRAETQSSSIDNDKTLAEACTDGDVDAVKRLLSEGRSVHETNEDGESLLSLACSAGYYELAEVLLRMRANVEDRGIKGDCTPLMEASSGGFEDVVRLLVAYDADVNAQSSAGHTALHHAAVGGHENVVQLLITSGANVEEQNENGHTPLMESASAGHVGVAKILLNAGAGINTHSNEFKESALTLACYKGHLEMVKFLLDAGADQEHKTDEMHTALMEASMDGHVEVARLLLDSGAQVNMPADSFESPLTLAACGGHVDLASLLIERGANLEEVNDEGYTPLMEASREGHDEMVILLLANGADVNAQTEETQETALTLACCGGFVEVAHFLIEASADLELGCSTPLMEASQEGHIDLVKYLIKEGSDIHALTGTNDSALTYACENGHTDVVDVLLQAGAKLEHESEGGRTPLMKAARAGHLCTVQFLISKGAKVNRSTANNEHTVLSLACAGGHLGVVELLLEHGADPMHKLKDGSTMLIEAAKGGHTTVVNLLLDYPNGMHKSLAAASAVSSEYPDSIPMADDLPADPSSCKDLSLKSTESLATRLEQFIHKMMSQAENSSGTREEQMARKQEILEELQRVEQELKFRTQLAQENQRLPLGYHDRSSGDSNNHPLVPLSLSPPPNILPSHEYVEQELQQKQQAIAEQQKHEAQLQQQKEYYQAKLQLLKHQYQEKQLQLQQQRQQLLSQAANNPAAVSTSEEYSEAEVISRQAIPLHIALQNHLHAHHVTEGNVDDLAQALQEWDTRDRNIRLLQSQVKPMPTFNLNSKHEDINCGLGEPVVSELSLPMEDMAFTETPPSRSLADSLATLIQGMDYQPSGMDTSLAKAMESSSSSMKRTHHDYEAFQTLQTLQWLKKMDAACGDGSTSSEPPLTATTSAAVPSNNPPNQQLTELVHAPKSMTKRASEFPDRQTNTNTISKVLNGYVEPLSAAELDTISSTSKTMPTTTTATCPHSTGRPSTAVVVPPSPQHSVSPPPRPAVPFVDPNAETDSNHDTALTLACAGGHAQLVKLLLSRNAEIEHRDKKGFTPLILASTAGHSDVVEILIENHADIEAQSERTKDTPLSLACSGGRYEVVEILLRLGANKEHRNVSDYTPLSLAASGGYVNIIKLLLSYGAEINSRTGSKLGISPLMLAAMNGHTAAVKLLLDMGSDINAQIETNRNTALTLACFQGRHDVVSLLVDRKANIEHRAKTGLTPLMEAASGGYVDVGKVLLDKAADVNAPPVPSSKDTALTIAADKGHYRFVELLLSRGAAVDVKNKKGNSPLWLACNGGHLDVVQLLVSNHADIDSQDNRRVSSLMAAFRRGHIKVVKWLVRHVTQFPGDPELSRYIATVSDQELLKKCQQCMTIIHQAKEQQNTEAMKNASILLKEVEFERSREEKRKEAAARKREKKKQKRKERQAEQQQGDKASGTSPEPVTTGEVVELADDEPGERVIDLKPLPTHSSLVIDVNDGEELQLMQNVQKKNSVNIKRSDDDQHKSGGGQNVYYSRIEEHADKENSAASKRNRRNKDLSRVEFVESSQTVRRDANKSSQMKPPNGKLPASKSTSAKIVTSSTRIAELDDFGDLPLPPNSSSGSRSSTSKRNQRGGVSSSISQLDSFDGGYVSHTSKYGSPSKSGKTVGLSPSPGKKRREDGSGAGSDWKQVTNKKGKKIAIPSKCVSHVSKSIHAIKDKSGAHIEFEKSAEKRSAADRKPAGGGGDRNIIIRGSADAIRNAHNLVSVLLRDSNHEVESQSHKRSSSTVSLSNSNNNMASTSQNATGSLSVPQRNSMASIGTFNLADYLPNATAQIPVPPPAVDSVQSRPGWQVRPSIVGQSAWGAPNPTTSRPSSAGDSTQQTMSPRSTKATTGPRLPSSTTQPFSSPKQANEVSRQLFPVENVSYGGPQRGPPPTSATPPIAPAPNNLLPAQFTSQQRSPVQHQHNGSSAITMAYNMSSNPLLSTGSVASGHNTSGPPAPSSIQGSSPRVGSHAMSYSPFDSQMNKPLLAGNKPAFHSATMDRSHVDPNKAPGFRPSVSPQLGQYPTSSAHQMSSDELHFSGSNRAVSGLHVAISNAEQLMSPLTSRTISTNVHALFSDDSNGMPQHMHPSALETAQLLSLRDQYTTIDQPMTLPRISSSLNPNASVFTAPHRFGGDSGGGMQQSSRANLMHHRQQAPSPVNYLAGSDDPPLSIYQSQPLRANLTSTSVSSSQNMMRSAMYPSAASHPTNPQNLSLTTEAVVQSSKQEMQSAPSFSPSSNRPRLVTTSPSDGGVNVHQIGDGAHRVNPASDEDSVPLMNPIGGERSYKQPSVFPSVPDIWSSNKVNDAEWGAPGMNMPILYPMGDQSSHISSASAGLNDTINDPAFLHSVFKAVADKPDTVMRGLPTMVSQFQFYSGAAGDGVQSTWHNSKLTPTQNWPGWDKTNNDG